jgi:hypothetical protein
MWIGFIWLRITLLSTSRTDNSRGDCKPTEWPFSLKTARPRLAACSHCVSLWTLGTGDGGIVHERVHLTACESLALSRMLGFRLLQLWPPRIKPFIGTVVTYQTTRRHIPEENALVPGCRSRGHNFWEVVGLERGSLSLWLQLRSYLEEQVAASV